MSTTYAKILAIYWQMDLKYLLQISVMLKIIPISLTENHHFLTNKNNINRRSVERIHEENYNLYKIHLV